MPVVKDGMLYDKYMKENNDKDNEDASVETVAEVSNGFVEPELESKYKFRVQEPYELNPNLHSMSDEDEDDIFDARDQNGDETVHLLEDRTVFVNKKNAGYPVNICESTLTEFMSKMDEKIQKDVDEVECKNENLEEVVSSLDKQVVFPMGERDPGEKYGTVCSLTWKHFVLIICLVAVIVPTIYFIHFKNEHDMHHPHESVHDNVTKPPLPE